MKFETKLDFFTGFVIVVKIIFILSAIGHIFLSHSVSSTAKKLDPKLVELKENMEFIFIISMSILLIYHFKPGHQYVIDRETALLFFLFGWVLIITSKWSVFLKNTTLYKKFVSYIN